jgi:hypothetical protein
MNAGRRGSICKCPGTGELSIKSMEKSEFHPFLKLDGGDKINVANSLNDIKVLATKSFFKP